MRFKVPDMSCGHCQKAIEDALEKLDKQARVQVDLDARQVEVESQTLDGAAVQQALNAIGFSSEACD